MEWRICVTAAATLAIAAAAPPKLPDGDWWSFGRDEAGARFSPLGEITPENVKTLIPVWTFELRPADSATKRLLVSNMTPLAVDGILYLATPYGRVVALDGDSGKTRWAF